MLLHIRACSLFLHLHGGRYDSNAIIDGFIAVQETSFRKVLSDREAQQWKQSVNFMLAATVC